MKSIRKSKRIIIMGASSGIGLCLAEILASRGITIGLAARNEVPMAQLAKKYPKTVKYASIDIDKPEAVEKLYQLIEQLGGMDIYLHVAGIYAENVEMDPECEAAIANTDCVGFARMLSGAWRWFREHDKAGQIAAVTSVAGTNGIGRLASYSASKAFGQTYLRALEQLSNMEGAEIDFTDIRPGWTSTPLISPNRIYPMTMTPEHVATQIIFAIVNRKRVWVVDWRWNIAVGLWRLIPNRIWSHLPIKLSKPDIPLP